VFLTGGIPERIPVIGIRKAGFRICLIFKRAKGFGFLVKQEYF